MREGHESMLFSLTNKEKMREIVETHYSLAYSEHKKIFEEHKLPDEDIFKLYKKLQQLNGDREYYQRKAESQKEKGLS